MLKTVTSMLSDASISINCLRSVFFSHCTANSLDNWYRVIAALAIVTTWQISDPGHHARVYAPYAQILFPGVLPDVQSRSGRPTGCESLALHSLLQACARHRAPSRLPCAEYHRF